MKKLKNSTNKKVEKLQKLIKEVQKKKAKQKKTKGVLICREAQNVHTENMKKYLFTKNKQSYRILEYTVFCSGQSCGMIMD